MPGTLHETEQQLVQHVRENLDHLSLDTHLVRKQRKEPGNNLLAIREVLLRDEDGQERVEDLPVGGLQLGVVVHLLKRLDPLLLE